MGKKQKKGYSKLEKENSKTGLEEIMSLLKEQDDLIHSSDNKINFNLVFLVALLAMFIQIILEFNKLSNGLRKGVLLSLLVGGIISISIAAIFALLALLPSTHSGVDYNALSNDEKYQNKAYHLQRIKTYTLVLANNQKYIDKKNKKSKISYIFSLCALLFLVLSLCFLFFPY